MEISKFCYQCKMYGKDNYANDMGDMIPTSTINYFMKKKVSSKEDTERSMR